MQVDTEGGKVINWTLNSLIKNYNYRWPNMLASGSSDSQEVQNFWTGDKTIECTRTNLGKKISWKLTTFMYCKRCHLVCEVNGNQGKPSLNENEDNGKEIEVYYEPAERDSNGIIIGCM